ncbi:MAG: hypothetical protein ACOX6I_10225 [Syntrophomonadaceae bacterium]
MRVLGLIVLFGALVLIDLRGLLETNQRHKTMAIYFFLIAVGLTLSILVAVDQAPPSPAVVMERIIRVIIPGEYTVQ